MKKLVTIWYKVYTGSQIYDVRPRKLEKLIMNLLEDRKTISRHGLDIKIVPVESYIDADKTDMSKIDCLDDVA